MQQAVTSTQISLTPTTSIAISSLNRNVLRAKLNQILHLLDRHLQNVKVVDLSSFKLKLNKKIDQLESRQQKNAFESPKSIKNNQPSVNEQLCAILKTLEQDLNKPESTLVVDSLIAPIVRDKNNSFYENKYGFSESNLLKSEYCEPFSTKNKKILLNSLNTIQFSQQKRGFKTRRNIDRDENDSSSFSNMFNIKNLIQPKSSTTDDLNAFKTIVDGKSSKGAKLGSIFGDKSLASSQANSGNDLDSKLKVAFVEGFLYKQNKDEKIAGKKTMNQFIFRTAIILLIIFVILNSVTITTSGNGGNGKNGNTVGSGINLRALTGQMNFEVSPETVSVKFDDVKGLPEAKKELVEIVDFLKVILLGLIYLRNCL
jgi:hypothetical protein